MHRISLSKAGVLIYVLLIHFFKTNRALSKNLFLDQYLKTHFTFRQHRVYRTLLVTMVTYYRNDSTAATYTCKVIMWDCFRIRS